MKVAETRMQWVTGLDRIRNGRIRERSDVANVAGKTRENYYSIGLLTEMVGAC